MISYSASEAKQNFVAMVIPPEEYQRLHALNVDRLMAICEKASAEAEVHGLTEALLERLLANDD